MRKITVFVILVIVLVSLNWFKSLFAQSLSDLTLEQQQLLKSYQQKTQPKSSPEIETYTTPNLYDSSGQTVASDISQFQGKVTKQAGKLRPFGLDIFSNATEAFPPDDIASSPDYILGPGDNIVVYLWGRVEKEYQLTVDRQGMIIVPKVGEIQASGLSLSEFKAHLHKKLTVAYSDFQLTVSLGKIRSIRIYLTGEVLRPGAYTVSSLTSLYNALYAAGGPSETGTLRDIRLMRAGKLLASVDVYDFLLSGNNQLDIRLQSGDAIFVPVVGSRVTVDGKVKRPAIYELKGGETAGDILALCGGALPDAYLDRVMLERVAGLGEWEVLDLDLDTTNGSKTAGQTLFDGDKLTIYSVFELLENMVAVQGKVKHPGFYERNDSTRIADILAKAELQTYDVHLERAILFRIFPDSRSQIVPINLELALADHPEHNLLLQNRDSLQVYSRQELTWQPNVHISGEIQKPGTYRFYDGMTAADLVFLAGSYTRSASRVRAEVGRVDELGEVTLEYIDLNSADLGNVILSEDDHVFIRQIPQWRVHRSVTIDGEVAFPGEYLLSGDKETFYDLLNRAGGFTGNAFPSGVVFERQSIRTTLDRLRVATLISKTNPITRDSLGRLERTDLFEYDPGSVSRLVIDVPTILSTNGRVGDVILEPGDKIYVPPTPSGISVLGAVASNGTIKYQDDKSARFYIREAGNFTEQANGHGTNLIKANGRVLSGKNALRAHVEVGDVIIVPTKIEERRDFSKTLTTILSATTGVLTTALLIDKL